jgi:hypothetical protein
MRQTLTAILWGTIISVALLFFGGLFVLAEKESNHTLRDILSKPTPMTSSYEVVDVVSGEYHLVDVSLDGNDQGTFILEGDYEVGDVVTVLWATEGSTEIAGDVLVGKANELDKQHWRGSPTE